MTTEVITEEIQPNILPAQRIAPQKQPPTMLGPKVLLLTNNHVGNTLFCTPGIRLLKQQFPTVQFDAVAMSRRAAAALLDNPAINKVYCLSSKWRIRRLAKRYNQVIGLHYDKFRQYFPADTATCYAINEPRHDRHRTQEIIEFVQSLSPVPAEKIEHNYVLNFRPEHLNNIQRVLPADPAQEAPLVGIALGCGRVAIHGWKIWYSKRHYAENLWPLQRYINLAQALQQHNPAIRFVLTGSRNEKPLGAAFARAVPGTINLIGRTALQDVAALMTYLRLFITHDTGTLHVACSSKVPIVALFGPTQLTRTGPYPLRSWHTVIKKNQMDEITAQEVMAASIAALREGN